ncbi:hypothetical protein ACM55G_11990 [Flavobacterium sp. LB3P122]|uniref:hypothetical protein n=1 Tax=Flavobacterium algoriphilum TaxID=3398738 RepID=UPI003A864797
MNEIQKLRIKSAMIFYELESSLGNYVIENEILDNISDKSKKSILKRDIQNYKGSNDDISFLVESSYLDEVFNLAIDVTAGTSLNKHMIDLKDLCTYLGIFDIRNAISHPNRPFPDSYWFKSATIASDPLIEKLGLEKVRQALNAALAENLHSPPEDWYNDVKWAIPNNLPNSFDHEITGLLGRDKEFKDLYSTISKVRNNLIAVVAPGGIGKTALILQFLKELSLTPTFSKQISSIVFCTLKNERLTADGIEQIEAINGIDQIKESLLLDLNILYDNFNFVSFDDACDKLENEKVLICIDNLETLLMNSQNEFIDFNQSLPQQWRVIVTSRISVDSATTVPLEPLVKRHAINLARNYFRKRGVQNTEQLTLENIAEMANNNPLAIRLTIDLFNKGVDISKSINQSQKNIALFSYKNLIESLNQNSIAILEATYILTESTKVELTEFLHFSNEEVSESINELSKTSLIFRATNDFGIESYKLSDSIRDLLLINPKNIEVRSKISESLKKLKEKIQLQKSRDEQSGITEFEENYIEDRTDRSTFALIVDLNKYFTTTKNHNELSSLKTRFTDLLGYNSKDNQLKYHYSRVLKELSDKPGELKVLEQSQLINPNSPRTIIAIGKHHFYNGDYPIAIEVFNQLLEKKYDNPNISSRSFSHTLTKLNLLCLLYLNKYDKILEITKNWETEQNWRTIYGTYRASTYKRQSEQLKGNLTKRELVISNSLDTFDLLFRDKDYPIFACIEANKIIKEFDFVLNNDYSQSITSKYATFISKHYFNIISQLRGESIESKESKELLDKIYNANIISNPLHSVGWYSEKHITTYDQEHINELISEGYIIVEVYNIPEKDKGLSNFIFAKDNNENQFFLVVANYKGGWNGWGFIEIGTKLAIKHNIAPYENEKATPATEIVEIDQYLI